MRPLRVLFIILTAGAIGAACAVAGVDLPLGLPAPPDPAQLFEAITSHALDLPVPKVKDAVRVLPNPDDAAVALFIAAHAARPPEEILGLRHQGLAWCDVSKRVGIATDVYFVVETKSETPPFGRAYGHYKRHGADRRNLRLTDVEIRDLVAVRLAHDYYGIPAERAMELRRQRGDVRALMVGEYHERHGRHDERHRGEGHGKDEGRGEHGHGHDHD